MSNYIERYWRDATPADAIKEPPMVARFRSGVNQEWTMDTLQGIDRSEPSKWRGKDVTCRYCQVYDAPDPGEGYRLIDPDKDDYSQDGIDFWYPEGRQWCSRASVGRDKQRFTIDNLVYYRIRITSTVTYVPFTWEDREQLRGRWITKENREVQITCLSYSKALFINGMHAEDALRDWKFLDTGKPVGKEVAQ